MATQGSAAADSHKLPAINAGRATVTEAAHGIHDSDDEMQDASSEDESTQTLQVGHRPVDRVLATFQQEERFDAFTSLTLNYVALHQKISAMGSLRESVQRLAQALEGIPSWRVDGSWTSAHLRETMLRSGIDQVVQTTGGQGFIYLFGRALELRSAEESNDIFHFYSASAQSAFMYMQKKYMERNDISDVTMVHERDVAPRFGDQHTPLFKTICNTGMPAVHSWKRLKALTLQRRANVPRHHFKLATTALLPFGTGTDGVLLGLSNGAYPELIVSELSRVARRFLDGVASTWRRLHEDEIRRNEEEVLRLRRKLEAEFTTALAAAARDSGDMELQLEQMCVVLEKRFGPACYIRMSFAGHGDKRKNKGSESSGGSSRKDRSAAGASSSKRSGALSGGGSRAPVRFDKFSMLRAVYSPEGLLKTELASIAESPNFGEMAGQIMTKAQPWTCVGQEEVSVFQGALLDSHRTVLFLPLWDEDETPLGMVVMFPLGDLATTPLTQQVAQRCLTDHINNINHSAAMLDAVFAQAIPTIILDDVREGQRSQLRRVRYEKDPVRKLALESLPMWSKRSSTTEPQFLLRSEMADSMVVGQSLKPEARQALYTSFWSQFTGAAAKIGESKILFVKTIGDAIVFLGGLRPITANKMFELGLSVHTITEHIMRDLTSGALLLPAKVSRSQQQTAKATVATAKDGNENEEEEEESEDEQMIFLNHDDIVKGGPALRVEFRSAVMGARTPEDLMSFVTPVGGQLRLDFAGMTAEYVQRVEAAAPAGQGVLTDVHTAAMLDHGSFRVSKPKTVQLRGFSASAELVLVTPELSNGRSANAAATAAALTVSPDHGPEPVPAAAGEGDRF
eukprot:TRINITY_DN1044_c0_g1_i1.p1 TRINITY_DN1044_c0_g1~~TRINITY_DN1044_c0_g1_i1.p1  ORF type:complete len:854 (+),score=274.79 TRINITY_DN1044_c0_g1_i1:1031-3592(+)